MVLTFDTETNGLPKNWKAKVTEVDAWPRLAQIAYSTSDLKTGELFKGYQTLIKPDGWTIPTVEELRKSGSKDPDFFVNNNMSTERCQDEGIEVYEALEIIRDDLFNSSVMVAHNMNFDEKILGAEFIRAKMKVGRIVPRVCTKEVSTAYCKLPPYRYGKYKWPTLMELYVKLFGKEFEGAHDAADDETACRECFHELVRLKVINYSTYL